jgi:hypothetical protein
MIPHLCKQRMARAHCPMTAPDSEEALRRLDFGSRCGQRVAAEVCPLCGETVDIDDLAELDTLCAQPGAATEPEDVIS